MRRRILEHFGVGERRTYINQTFSVFQKDIENVVRDNDMIAVIGKVGSGKSTLFRHAVLSLKSNPDREPLFVHVRNKYKERMTISSILNAVIYDISDESPRHDLEARSRQVVRLLGRKAVIESRNVCIVIEEAHRLHMNTMRALKELREDEFDGVAPLFSVVLLGHPELAAKLESRREVFWRSQILTLNEANNWMTFDDRVQYLKWVYGEAITQKARKRIATLKRVPLSLDFFVENKMAEAHKAGKTVLDEHCFDVTPKELKEALNVSLQEIAQEAKIGKTTVHDVLTGYNKNQEATVKAALERLAEKKRNEREADVSTKVA